MADSHTIQGEDVSGRFDAGRAIAEVSGSNLSPETSKAILSIIRDTGRNRWFWAAFVIVPPLTALAARAPEIICALRGFEGCA